MASTTVRRTWRLVDAWLAYKSLRYLDSYYPGFQDWFFNKAVPDAITGRGVLIVAEQHSNIVGVALGRGGEKPKLRCVRVDPSLNGSGLGLRLIDKVLREINCDKPATTVAEEMFHDYSRILVNHYNFRLDKVAKGLYRFGKLEYIFNDASGSEFKRKTFY